MGEMGVWVEKSKTLLHKKELNSEIWGKWSATYGRNGCLGGEIEYLPAEPEQREHILEKVKHHLVEGGSVGHNIQLRGREARGVKW